MYDIFDDLGMATHTLFLLLIAPSIARAGEERNIFCFTEFIPFSFFQSMFRSFECLPTGP